MADLLKGKSAVVTGAGRGLGRAYAMALANEGANVVINDIGVGLNGAGGSKAPADEVAAEINKKNGGKAVPNYDNVSEDESASRIIKTCVDNFGRVDILVNNAGHFIQGNPFTQTPKEFDGLMKAHLYGTFFCSRHACVHMKKQKWGRIINITSLAYRGTVDSLAYSAAKGGIVTLMRSMAQDLNGLNITSNCISPGASTRFLASVLEHYKKQYEDGLIPLEEYQRYQGIASTPPAEFVAPMVVYLASEYSSGLNGAVLVVMGGRVSIENYPGDVSSVYKDDSKDGPWTIEELKRVIPAAIQPYCASPKPPD
jgi:NAD(P)-dependent dehydrogenase (short-subunit alcohol dehydrogenase family)